MTTGIHYIVSGYVGQITLVAITFTNVFEAFTIVEIVVALFGISRPPPHSPLGPGIMSELAFRDKILNATCLLGATT